MKIREALRGAWTLGIGLVLLAGMALAQERAAGPAFEVASIKPAPPLSRDMIRTGQLHMGINVKGTRADFGFMSLADLLPYAYRVKPYQIAGPEWLRESRWDILARLPEGESPDRVPEMLQALLAERFKLAVHRENRELPVYELVAAKSGLKLKPSEPEEEIPAADTAGNAAGNNVPVPGFFLGGGLSAGASNVRVSNEGRGIVVAGGPNGTMRVSQSPNGGMRLEMSRITMAAFADMLTPFTDRTVIDATELKGTWQVALDLPLEALMIMVQNAARMNGMAGLAGAGGGPAPGRLGNPFGGGPIGGAGAGQLPGAALDPSGSSIIQAVQELGLRLQARRAPIETIVVDHVEKSPTEN